MRKAAVAYWVELNFGAGNIGTPYSSYFHTPQRNIDLIHYLDCLTSV